MRSDASHFAEQRPVEPLRPPSLFLLFFPRGLGLRVWDLSVLGPRALGLLVLERVFPLGDSLGFKFKGLEPQIFKARSCLSCSQFYERDPLCPLFKVP